MTRISAKPKRQKQIEALERRVKNLADCRAGNVGTLTIPEDYDKNEILKDKIAKAEKEIEILNKAVGK